MAAMLQGAASRPVRREPAQFSAEVGPLKDREADDGLAQMPQLLSYKESKPITSKESAGVAIESVAATTTNLFAPPAYSCSTTASRSKTFGPLSAHHVLSRRPASADPADQRSGCNPTLGIKTRANNRAQQLASAAQAGKGDNNTDMIGAVVDCPALDGEGLTSTRSPAGRPAAAASAPNNPHREPGRCGQKPW